MAASQVPSRTFFGRNRPGGSQVFPEFGPKTVVKRKKQHYWICEI
jgi:hypothetical protein